MLSYLTICDLALVDRVELPFRPGLNVLTGETGAGKSVLVSALSMVLGARAQSDVVRAGAREAVVEALFEVSPGSLLAARVAAAGITAPDGQLLVRRTVAPGGRGRVRLNGQLATVSMLAEVLRGIVELTGQHEHVALLDAEQHLEFLDSFGGHGPLRAEVASAHSRVVRLDAELRDLETQARERARREDYLRFALDEIDACAPEVGELEQLEAELRRLRSAHTLTEGVTRADELLSEGPNAALEALGRVEATLERLETSDPSLGALTSAALEVVAGAQDLSMALARYRGALDLDPQRLQDVESRCESVRRLCKKYGGDEAAVLEHRARMQEDLDALDDHEARVTRLAEERAGASKQLERAAARLTKARQKASRELSAAIRSELEALSMTGTKLQVALRDLGEIGSKGAEVAELEFAPNRGEPARPLRKSASGGELSRVLLALKSVLAQRGEVCTHVFDEVDTGIGGAIAEVVGAKLSGVATSGQVVAVTHLPQVAAYADHHVRVRKIEEGGRTLTRVEDLDEEARVTELARMVGGLEITDRTLGLAEELRSRGRRPKVARGKVGEVRGKGAARRRKASKTDIREDILAVM